MGIEVAHLCVSIAGKNILQDLTIFFAEGKRTAPPMGELENF